MIITSITMVIQVHEHNELWEVRSKQLISQMRKEEEEETEEEEEGE